MYLLDFCRNKRGRIFTLLIEAKDVQRRQFAIDLQLPSTYLCVVTIWYPLRYVLALNVRVVCCAHVVSPRGCFVCQLKKLENFREAKSGVLNTRTAGTTRISVVLRDPVTNVSYVKLTVDNVCKPRVTN